MGLGWGPGTVAVAKSVPRYACQECGAVYPKWAGRCEACGAWNSLAEELPRAGPPKSLGGGRGGHTLDFVGLTGDSRGTARHLTGIAELDRVCGGGLVPGSAILVGERFGRRERGDRPSGPSRRWRRSSLNSQLALTSCDLASSLIGRPVRRCVSIKNRPMSIGAPLVSAVSYVLPHRPTRRSLMS